jgi:CubicO group peptidase (beta-lactamase class C family)
MNGRPAVAVVVLLMLLSASAVAQPRLSRDQPIPPAELEAFVDGVVRQTMTANNIAGATVSIVQDGRIVLTKGYGFADIAAGGRVNPDTTLFRIGSITKTFTWIAVMRAFEAGRLTLDDPINQHLPDELRIPDEGFTEPIRIRHLMTHSPGFEDRMFGHLFETDAAQVRRLATYLRDERPRRVREAGTVHSYSNYGVGLAGAALERIHGRPWQEQIEADILHPLGMTHTSVREPYPAREDLPAPMPGPLARLVSIGYRWNGVEHVPQPFEYISHGAPAGVISSTAGDMARYMLMLLGDGSLGETRIFGPGTGTAFRVAMSRLPPEVGNWNAGFLDVPLVGDFRSLGHDGGSLLFFSTMALVPELRLGVFVSTNTAGGDRLSGPLPGRIVERFYGSVPRPPKAGSKDLAAAAAAYDGFYVQTRRAYSGIEGFIFRLLTRRVRVTPEGYLIAPLFGPPQRYVAGNRDGVFEAVDAGGFAPAVLIRRDEGAATRIETPFMTFERVPFLMQPTTLIASGAIVVVLCLGTLLGFRLRFRRRLAETSAQRRATRIQGAAAVSWLIAGAGLAVFGMAVGSNESVLFAGWPPASLFVFSVSALLGAVLALLMIGLMPSVWRQGDAGWSTGRKVRYAIATVVLAWFSGLLAWWGALQPWELIRG